MDTWLSHLDGKPKSGILEESAMRLTASGIFVPGIASGISSVSAWLGAIPGGWIRRMMEPRRYGDNRADDHRGSRESKPMWKDALDSYGPSLTLAGVLLAVVMGWIPSKIMDGLDRNNQLMGTLASGADSQRELASTVKEMSSTIKAQSVTIAELRVLLTKQTEWNQDQCRLLAKALRSADANEKCDHINR